jgi:glycosyltransferase involved in cell wall biosynthesis
MVYSKSGKNFKTTSLYYESFRPRQCFYWRLENFGIAVAEALACAKPVLISNQVNIWREIHHAQAGLVADDTELGTIQLLTNWLKLSSAEQKQMGANACAAYMQHYAVEKAVQQMKDMLKD